jgi:hypothetical protein
MICMFDEFFFNSLLQPLGDNPWPTHLTNQNYRTRFLSQSNYLLGFVFLNKYSLEIIINKKWLENQNDSDEDEYESPTFVYCRETDTMVPLVRGNFQTPPRMQGSWNDNDTRMPEVVVESSRGVEQQTRSSVEGSPQYYHK